MIPPELLERAKAKGTPDQHLDFIRSKRSCLSNFYSEYTDDDVGRSVAAHVRRAWNSGTGTKPDYYAVPLTFSEHATQHTHGEAEAVNNHIKASTSERGVEVSSDEAKEIFDRLALRYLTEWVGS